MSTEQRPPALWMETTMEGPDGQKTTAVAPASTFIDEPDSVSLRLLSVRYEWSSEMGHGSRETVGAEAHVGPEDDCQAIYAMVQEWVHSKTSVSQDQLWRQREESEKLQRDQENVRTEIAWLEKKRNELVDLLEKIGVPVPMWIRTGSDLPF